MESIHILLAEDNEDHAFILERAFKDGNIKNVLNRVEDGQEAIEFLNDCLSKHSRLPGLILLDVNMPRMNGFETLEAIKSDDRLKHLPVVMLTSSARDEDIALSYAHGACSYISKPVKFEEFKEVINQFNLYWTLVAETPKA